MQNNTPLLETVSGTWVDIINPQNSTFDVDVIAWHLSRISRFCGATITETPYTVGQHSIFVARETIKMMDENDPEMVMAGLYALLHDASEAFTGDIPTPVKHHPSLYPILKVIEDDLQNEIFKQLSGGSSVSESVRKIVKHADKIAQRIEAHAFMPSRGRDWIGLPHVELLDLQSFSSPKDAKTVYTDFKKTYNVLTRLGASNSVEVKGELMTNFFPRLSVF